jgi:hypothetical protein
MSDEPRKSLGHRTKFHPLHGNGGPNAVGTYLGSAGGAHFFSAESTGGGETDSHVVHDHANFKFNGTVGQRYAFDRKTGNVGRVQPYNSGYHYGIPGAPLEHTPEEYHDSKYSAWTPREA